MLIMKNSKLLDCKVRISMYGIYYRAKKEGIFNGNFEKFLKRIKKIEVKNIKLKK